MQNKDIQVNGERDVQTETMRTYFTPEGLKYKPVIQAKKSPVKTVKPMSSDDESYTGPEEGFFAKFGSKETE